MALQIDYFAAASDDEAAALVNLETGVRSIPFDDESDAPAVEYDVVSSQAVDPGLALGYLNELLGGTLGWQVPQRSEERGRLTG